MNAAFDLALLLLLSPASACAVVERRSRRPTALVLCLVGLGLLAAGCRIPGPEMPRFAPPPPQAPVSVAEPTWHGTDEEEAPPPPSDPRPSGRARSGSPLGTNLPPLTPGAEPLVFADRFRHARGWRSVDRRGRDDPRSLDLGPRGWVRRLARGQAASTRVPARAGARYVVRHRGDGRLAFPDARAVEPDGPQRFRVTAGGPELTLRVERTSPTSPLRAISVFPEELAEAEPLFAPELLERLAPFGVLRFAGWSRVGQGAPGTWSERASPDDATQAGPSGAAWEHAIALANAVGADAWVAVPFAADDAYAAALAELLESRLDPSLRVYVEYGDEAWSPDRTRPGVQVLEAAAEPLQLDPDPTIARLLYQARRTVELFRIFEQTLARDRLVRVVSAPFGAPETVERLLAYEDTARWVDAVAVAPRVGGELGTPARAALVETGVDETLRRIEEVELPSALSAVRGVAEVVERVGLPLITYGGGLELEPAPDLESARAREVLAEVRATPGAAASLRALLDGWKAAGGQLFVVAAELGPVGEDARRSAEAPIQVALRRFARNNPRWWKERDRGSLARVDTEVAEPAAIGSPAPPPPKLYTAPWVKWVSLGVGAALGVAATERFLAAEDAARLRDARLQDLAGLTGDPDVFDALQAEVRDHESDRAFAQGLGFGAVGLASALVGWAIAQWLEEPPEPEIEVPSWAVEGSR